MYRAGTAVSDARIALPDFDNIAIRIANVAAGLAVFGLWLRDKLRSPASPLFIAGLNICNADIHKAADFIGIGGDAEGYRWFVGCRPPPELTRSQVFAIWMYPGAPSLSPPLRMRPPKTFS